MLVVVPRLALRRAVVLIKCLAPTPAQVPSAEFKQSGRLRSRGEPERTSKWINVLELGADRIADEIPGTSVDVGCWLNEESAKCPKGLCR